MESVDKLRDWAKRYGPMGSHDPLMLANAIEREIAERFVELPVDADGVPIRVGDVVASDYEMPTKVTCIDMSLAEGEEPAWVLMWGDPMRYGDEDNDWGSFPDQPSSYRHVKPRTIEDVLTDLAEDVERGCPPLNAVAKYIGQLRELMGVGE